MVRLNYREGDWVAVPVGDHGEYVLGLIARASGKGALICYFFGGRFRGVPSAADAELLAPADAVLVGRCGDLGDIKGKWPVLGRVGVWDRARWRTQVFKFANPYLGAVEVSVYDDDNPEVQLSKRRLPPGEDIQAPRDSLMGAEFVEERLTRLTA